MRRRRLLLLSGTCLAAALDVVTTIVSAPQAMRIALGVLIVFVLPGFAILCAVLPEPQLSLVEWCLASAGASLAVTVCATVLLGATAVGLSQQSLSLTLAGTTIAASVFAGARIRHAEEA